MYAVLVYNIKSLTVSKLHGFFIISNYPINFSKKVLGIVQIVQCSGIIYCVLFNFIL